MLFPVDSKVQSVQNAAAIAEFPFQTGQKVSPVFLQNLADQLIDSHSEPGWNVHVGSRAGRQPGSC